MIYEQVDWEKIFEELSSVDRNSEQSFEKIFSSCNRLSISIAFAVNENKLNFSSNQYATFTKVYEYISNCVKQLEKDSKNPKLVKNKREIKKCLHRFYLVENNFLQYFYSPSPEKKFNAIKNFVEKDFFSLQHMEGFRPEALWHNIGIMYEHGEGTEKNNILAKEYYKKAAEKGLPRSQFEMGKQLLREEKYSQSFDYFKKSLNPQKEFESEIVGDAAAYMGAMVRFGLVLSKNGEPDINKAKEFFEHPRASNSMNAHLEYGYLLIEEGDQARGYNYLIKAIQTKPYNTNDDRFLIKAKMLCDVFRYFIFHYEGKIYDDNNKMYPQFCHLRELPAKLNEHVVDHLATLSPTHKKEYYQTVVNNGTYKTLKDIADAIRKFLLTFSSLNQSNQNDFDEILRIRPKIQGIGDKFDFSRTLTDIKRFFNEQSNLICREKQLLNLLKDDLFLIEFKALLDALPERDIDSFSIIQFFKLIQRIGIHPDDPLISQKLRKAFQIVSIRPVSFTTRERIELVYCYACLGLNQNDFDTYVIKGLLSDALIPKLDTLKFNSCCLMLYSLTLMRYSFEAERQSDTFSKNGYITRLLKTLMKRTVDAFLDEYHLGNEDYKNEQKQQEQLKSFSWSANSKLPSDATINQLKMSVYQLTHRYDFFNKKKNPSLSLVNLQDLLTLFPKKKVITNKSRLQSDIFSIIQKIYHNKKGIVVEEEVSIEGSSPIDILLKYDGNLFPINVDGTTHFQARRSSGDNQISLTFNPKTRLREDNLRIAGLKKSINFSYSEFQGLDKNTQWEPHIKEKLDQAIFPSPETCVAENCSHKSGSLATNPNSLMAKNQFGSSEKFVGSALCMEGQASQSKLS